MNKKVSFIIPVYNCEKYLEDCVNDLISVGLEKYEIILVDDGSTDCSGSICDEISKKQKNIVLIHQKNRGVSAARNKGLELATGEFVIFIDADDNIESLKLLNVLEIIDREDSIDLLIYGISFDYYKNGICYRSEDLCYNLDGNLNEKEWCEIFYDLFSANSLSSLWNKIFRKKIIVNHSLKLSENMFLYEDFEFVLRYMACCKNIYCSKEIVYRYRQAEDEGNAKRRLKRIYSIKGFIKPIEDAMDNLIGCLNICEQSVQMELRRVLLTLYLNLAKMKIWSSSKKEIRHICEEMSSWYSNYPVETGENLSDSDRKYMQKIINKKVLWLIINREYIYVRHKVAVVIKSMKWYQKLRR